MNSFPKCHAVTGRRIGYASGSKHVITATEDLQGHTTSNPCRIFPFVAESALPNDVGRFMKKVNVVPEERLVIAIPIVGSIKERSCTSAEGAFYLFANAQSKLGRSYRGQVIKSVGPSAS